MYILLDVFILFLAYCFQCKLLGIKEIICYITKLTELIKLTCLFLEHDPLLNAAYEIEPVTEESLEMHFWTYKQKVSLEHLRCSLQQEDMKQKYALLYDFLQLVR